jgi:hypothetical protein
MTQHEALRFRRETRDMSIQDTSFHNTVFFYGGPLSQWYSSPFTHNEHTFNCAEQYMMLKKAMLFEDLDTAHKIMLSQDPREQKALGRQVKNFDADVWAYMAEANVIQANLLKFGQNIELWDYLRGTGNRELVEASPTDRIWGIGLGMGNPDRFDRSKWRGTNLLGECLMKVRAQLREEEAMMKQAPHHYPPFVVR